jgi:hypothetical protein
MFEMEMVAHHRVHLHHEGHVALRRGAASVGLLHGGDLIRPE